MKYWLLTLLLGWLASPSVAQSRQKAIAGLEECFRHNDQYVHTGIQTADGSGSTIYYYRVDKEQGTLIVRTVTTTNYIKPTRQTIDSARYILYLKDVSELKNPPETYQFDLVVFNDKNILVTRFNSSHRQGNTSNLKMLTIWIFPTLTYGKLFKDSWTNLIKANRQARPHP